MFTDSILFLFFGGIMGSALLWLGFKLKKGSFETLAASIIDQAERKGKELLLKAEFEIKEKEISSKKELELHWQKEKLNLASEEKRIIDKEEKIESRYQAIEKKYADLEKKESKLHSKEELLEKKINLAILKEAEWEQKITSLSGLTKEEAKIAFQESIYKEIKSDAEKSAKHILKEAKENSEKEAKKIIATAIGRLAAQAVSEHTITAIKVPSNEIKGRIIGREGRNIRHLEQLTGVNFIIDDTPGEVILSSFNPVRRQVAKLALQDLIADGRIHPSRIEEAVEKAKEQIEKSSLDAGESAASRAGVIGLDKEILKLLGKLSFRTSYGQNVLEHSIEVSRLMGIMASELRLDRKLAERIGLLHDMGKALTHEVPGTHALIGHDFALKHGESEAVANGIGCHHGEIEALTVEGSLCSAADTLSASRPGARIDAIENYIERIKNLEELAYEFPGVEKSYALQSGKEIRVIVLPEMVDDLGMINLARDLTKRIEAKLDYPGKIKVTVIRERRAVEYAI